jgi:uncharacterized OB-fold protein
MTDKPIPEPDALSAPFWAGARQHRLMIQRCSHCGRLEHPPVGICQGCRNPASSFRFQMMSGKGRLISWTIMRDSFIPSFKRDVPFAIGLVELVEQTGVRLITRLIDGPDAAYRVGASLEVTFEDLTDAIALPQFRLTTP